MREPVWNEETGGRRVEGESGLRHSDKKRSPQGAFFYRKQGEGRTRTRHERFCKKGGAKRAEGERSESGIRSAATERNKGCPDSAPGRAEPEASKCRWRQKNSLNSGPSTFEGNLDYFLKAVVHQLQAFTSCYPAIMRYNNNSWIIESLIKIHACYVKF